MAVTRRQLHQVWLSNSRHLRSGHVPRAPSVSFKPTRRPRQTGRRAVGCSRLPSDLDHVDEGSRYQQIQGPGADRDASAALGASHVTSSAREEALNSHLYVKLTSQRWPLPSPQKSESSENDAVPTTSSRFASDNLDAATGSAPNSETAIALLSSDELEEAGNPQDGKWDITAAHEHRFCFEHGEDEWLLGYGDRWMYPSDYKVTGVEAVLEAKLQGYQQTQRELTAHDRICRAECTEPVWSQIDTPIQKHTVENGVIYRIRWKLCWTLQSSIDDMDWVLASYEEQNKLSGRRQSARLERTAMERVAKREAVMVVVNLEDLL